MKNSLIQLAQEAGNNILSFYGDQIFSFKSDKSPLTLADLASHDYLVKHLSEIYNVPVISEESYAPYHLRKNWEEFWLIDPLDGTKEFLNGYTDFSLNIAFIKHGKPIIGLIYAPLLKELYYAEKGNGFFYDGPSCTRDFMDLKVAASRFHYSDKLGTFMKRNNLLHVSEIGGALKFGRLALQQVDIYPRFVGSKEWDTAAGNIILEESGGSMIDIKTLGRPCYNKVVLQNNFFLALRKGLSSDLFFLED